MAIVQLEPAPTETSSVLVRGDRDGGQCKDWPLDELNVACHYLPYGHLL